MKKHTNDLTTFGGRLKYGMEARDFSAQKLAQELCRNGFSCTRKNVEQWWLINDATWRGEPELNPAGQWVIPNKGSPLKNSRPPYPGEIQLIVLLLKINGMWLFIGGGLPMWRGGDSLPNSREQLEQMWKSDPATRSLVSYVMGLDADAKMHMVNYLKATGQINE